jgi:hypothetical protein
MAVRVSFTIALSAVLTAFAVPTASKADPRVLAKLGSCPRGALVLSRQDLRNAQRLVFRFATGNWARKSRLQTLSARVSGVRTAPRWEKGGFVRKWCGRTTWRRTAVVSVLYPAMYYAYSDPTAPGPCNACAGASFLASRTDRGWLIWYVV